MRGGLIAKGPEGSLSLDADRATGVIYVEGRGVWTEALIARHFADLERLVEEWRGRFGGARVFVDTRAAGEQPEAVETYLRDRITALYREGDRIATLVAVDLRRISVAPRVDAANRKLFDDPIAAIRWLALE